MQDKFISCTTYSNTTLVKVKLYLLAEMKKTLQNSNTTLVKVKFFYILTINTTTIIQIQHLLKLNMLKVEEMNF